MASNAQSAGTEVQTYPAPRRRRSFVVATGLLLLLLFIALGASWIAKRSGKQTGGRPPAPVSVQKATLANIPETLTALGTVQPVVTATVRTQLAGSLFKLFFRDGQMVRQGQVLAQIDPRPYQLALAQSKATLARDQAQLKGAEVDLARYQKLLREDSIASQQVDTQRATVNQLEGTVSADRAAIGTANLNLNYTSIRAPVTGRAGIRQVDIGNYLTASDTSGIVVITVLNPIDVSFSLPQAQIGDIGTSSTSGIGLPVQVLDQNDNHLIASGRFLTLDNELDTTTGTVKAKARFDNSSNVLFPNEFVNVSLLVKTLQNVVSVPVSAVRHGAPGDFVFVLEPGRTVKLTTVTTGPSVGSTIAILSGLSAGATVVTEGADGLEDGSKVKLPGDKGGPSTAGAAASGKRGGGGHHRHKGANASA